MLAHRMKIYDYEFVFVSIYITSKMLWDSIPYVFELIFWGIILWNAVIFIFQSIRKKIYGKLLILIGIFCSFVLFDALLQNSIKVISRCIYEYIMYMLIMFYFIEMRKKINLLQCLKIISFWGAIISLLTWFEYITKQYLLTDLSQYGQIFYVGSNGFRAAVFTRSFLSHGVVLGVFAIISVYVWYETRKSIFLLIGILSFVAILATGSRGPLVSFFVALAFFYFADTFWIQKRRSKKDKFFLVGIGCLSLLIIVLSVEVDPASSSISYFIYRIQNIFNWKGDAGNSGRILIWKKAVQEWFLKSPIIGIGPSKTGSWGDGSLGVTESGILKKLCELGIVGTGLFYLNVFYLLKGCLKLHNKKYKKEAIFWLAIFIGIFVNEITVQSTEEIMVAFWWWCSLGAIFYLKIFDKKEKNLYEENCLYNECGLELD